MKTLVFFLNFFSEIEPLRAKSGQSDDVSAAE